MTIKTTDIFKRSFKKLFKKDKLLINEYEELLIKLEQNPNLGIDLGNGRYKLRLQNRSNNKGKSAGYRVITYTKIDDIVLLVHIYSKSDTENILDKKIDEIITNYKVDNI